MGLKAGGNDVTDVKVGSTDVNEIYIGSTRVWTRGYKALRWNFGWSPDNPDEVRECMMDQDAGAVVPAGAVNTHGYSWQTPGNAFDLNNFTGARAGMTPSLGWDFTDPQQFTRVGLRIGNNRANENLIIEGQNADDSWSELVNVTQDFNQNTNYWFTL